MKVTRRVALEVVHHEGIVREAYKDSVGVWTWSVGLTNSSGHNVERYIDKPQSLEHCLGVFVWALDNYADAVRKAFPGGLTEEQFAAALSFHWNTGAISTATWVKQWNAGDQSKARKSIMNWKSPPEIIPRRKAERDLFFDGKWSGTGMVTEYPVTASHTPAWNLAKRVDISDALDAAMGATERPADAPSALAHDEIPKAQGGLWAAILGLLRGMVK